MGFHMSPEVNKIYLLHIQEAIGSDYVSEEQVLSIDINILYILVKMRYKSTYRQL